MSDPAPPFDVHTCHAHGCGTPVPPRMLMCRAHWRKLPKYIQDAVWREYREGQEKDKRPSLRYLAVQRLAVGRVAFSPRDEEAAKIAAEYLAQATQLRQRAIAQGLGDPLAGFEKGLADPLAGLVCARRPAQQDLLSYVAPEPEPTRRETPPPPPRPTCSRPWRPRLMVLDACNFAHGKWHAPGNMPPRDAVGFALHRLRSEIQPTHAVAVWDGRGPTWRHEEWPQYKAARPPTPEPLRRFLHAVRGDLAGAGLATAAQAGIEADDLIASYARAASRVQWDVSIVSSDKDFAQLVRDDEAARVELVHPGHLRRMCVEEVREKWSVWPHAIPDLLALMGDRSDGIPGIDGIGKVTAERLIANHGGLEQILDRVELVSGAKIRERLKAQADQARLFLRLTTLRDDLPLPVPLEHTEWRKGPKR